MPLPQASHGGDPAYGRAWRDKQIELFAYWICIFLAAYSVLRPTFNFYSYSAARLSDFSAIAALALVTIIGASFAGTFPVKTLAIKLGWGIALYCVVFISLIGQGFSSSFTISDFASLALPALMFLSISAGYFSSYTFTSLKQIERGILLLACLSFFIALFQAVLPGPATIVWKVYSVQNALQGFHSGRPTAFFYHFTELADFLVMAGLIAFGHDSQKSSIRRALLVLLGVLLIAASVISTSRVGFIFLFLAGVYYALEDIIVHFSIRRLATYTVIFTAFIAAGAVFVMTDRRYGSLFAFMITALHHIDLKALAHVDNLSISNRAKQILVYLGVFQQHDYRILIGSGPLRQLEQSYFEIGWIKVLFRYGALGFFVYYSFFVGSFFTKATTGLERPVRAIRALCFAYLVSDCFSAVSEIVKGITVFLYWYGAVLGERDKRQTKALQVR